MRPKSIVIPDARDRGATLRVTRHPVQRKVVLSHWRGRLCVASTPIELGDVPTLVGVLVDALGEGAATATGPVGSEQAGFGGVVAAVRRWLRPHPAPIRQLRAGPESAAEECAS
jgi:hypothetical protein